MQSNHTYYNNIQVSMHNRTCLRYCNPRKKISGTQIAMNFHLARSYRHKGNKEVLDGIYREQFASKIGFRTWPLHGNFLASKKQTDTISNPRHLHLSNSCVFPDCLVADFIPYLENHGLYWSEPQIHKIL
jgi:hypothetical protein